MAAVQALTLPPTTLELIITAATRAQRNVMDHSPFSSSFRYQLGIFAASEGLPPTIVNGDAMREFCFSLWHDLEPTPTSGRVFQTVYPDAPMPAGIHLSHDIIHTVANSIPAARAYLMVCLKLHCLNDCR